MRVLPPATCDIHHGLRVSDRASCFSLTLLIALLLFFFFNDPATTEIYTLSLHDALPISFTCSLLVEDRIAKITLTGGCGVQLDRKSTRLNSSHTVISYAVFCLKKKNTIKKTDTSTTQSKKTVHFTFSTTPVPSSPHERTK